MQRIFALYARGYGYGLIIDQLNAEGRKTKRGQTFGKNSIAEILRNEKYIGRYVFNKRLKKGSNRQYKPDDQITRIDGALPAVIDKDTWFRVQAILEGRKRMPRQSNDRVYILSGKIFCGECGAPYVGAGYVGGRGGKRYYQYQCTNARQKKCTGKAIRQTAIEQYVLDQIRDKLLTDDQIENIANIVVTEKQKQERQRGVALPELKKRSAELKAKISKLLDLYLEDGIDKDTLKAKVNPMQDEADALDKQIVVYEQLDAGDGGKEEIKKYLHARQKSLEHADTASLQDLVDAFVKRVEVYDDHFDTVLTVDSVKVGGGEGS
ncbi:recombinase family protein [Ethanoligenens harbinense]|uniref:recombinase family protein n=2 Tax=Ethanoligenens harbinense TaxID=253239 RepID=UPI0001C526E3|nr:recombinase family protein [Ethanoligenens harbinense]